METTCLKSVQTQTTDSKEANNRRRLSSGRESLHDKLFDLEKEILEKCKHFGKALTIEPLRAQRRMTQEFFDTSEPLTPIIKKKMSMNRLFEIQIFDGSTVIQTQKEFSDKGQRLTNLFSSVFTINPDLTQSNAVSPQAILEQKPIIERNIQRFSNSYSDKDEPNSNNSIEEIRKLQLQNQEVVADVQKLQEEINILKSSKTDLSQFTIKKEKMLESSKYTNASVDTPIQFQVRRLKQLQQKIRKFEQKVYDYQRIFSKIYNLIHNQPIKDQPNIVNQIRTLKYVDIEDDLRTMIQKLRNLKEDIENSSSKKIIIQQQVTKLQERICQLAAKLNNLQNYEDKLISKKTVKCEFQLKNCTDGDYYEMSRILSGSLMDKKLTELGSIYETKILQKYRQIESLKIEKQQTIRQVLGSQYSQKDRKKIEVLVQTTESQNQLTQDLYVKRSFIRKTKRVKNVTLISCPNPELHTIENAKDRLVDQIIKQKSNIK